MDNEQRRLQPRSGHNEIRAKSRFAIFGRPNRFVSRLFSQCGFDGIRAVDALTSAGHSYVVDTGIEFTLQNLLAFDGIFLGEQQVDTGVLIEYVEAGGNIYLMGGTSVDAAAEAAAWAPFLNHFGLAFSTTGNGIGGNISIDSDHPLFAGVEQLFQDGGQSVIDLLPDDPNTEILVQLNEQGLYAISVYKRPVGLPGDFNEDGGVDAADYVVWRDSLGTTYSSSHYGLWRDNFGTAADGGAALSPVPEPSACVLLSLCAFGFATCRLRKPIRCK